jgi:tubulin polyglutamylase TTLL4
VHRYIANPYLINGHKFDLRLYVYVTSHDPLRIYLFDDGKNFHLMFSWGRYMKLMFYRFSPICFEKVCEILIGEEYLEEISIDYRYSASVKSLSDRFMHLTNYSINRYNSEYRTNNDSAACTGHKW